MTDNPKPSPLTSIEKWLPRKRPGSQYCTPWAQRMFQTILKIHFFEEQTRRLIMDKYAVVIDPDKIEKEKVGSKGGKPTTNPNVNIPLDDEKGSEPFERDPNDAKKSS